MREGKLEKARKILLQLYRSDPDNAYVLQALGGVSIRLHDTQQARVYLERAVDLLPDLPQAHHNLGYALTLLGERERGVEHLFRALEIDPTNASAYHNLVNILPTGESLKLLSNILILLKKENLDAYARQNLHFSAAHLLDAAGKYDDAFRHYVAANRARQITYGAQANDRLLNASRKVFDRKMFDQMGAGDLNHQIFIVGLPRSGTTLVERVLAAHPDIASAGESLNIGHIVRELSKLSDRNQSYPKCLQGITSDVYDRLAEWYRDDLRRKLGSPKVYVDKNPFNFQLLGLIALLFPKAVIFHCKRHPLDTALSLFRQNFTEGVEFSFSFAGIGHYYRYYEKMMALWESVLPIPIHQVDHGHLVSNFATEARRLVSLAGVDWHENCARFQGYDDTVYTASREQVRQPLNAKGVGHWRNYAQHLVPLIDALWPSDDP